MQLKPRQHHGPMNLTYRMQNGQSLTELAILGLVMVPLFLMIPILGKYIDINQTAFLGSRYAAWERTVYHTAADASKTDATIQEDVRRRIFGATGAPIKTNSVADQTKSEHRNLFWVQPRNGAPLLSFADVATTTTANSAMPTSASPYALPPTSAFVNRLGLANSGFYRSAVNVRVADVMGLKPLDAIGLTINRHNVILADTWAAASPTVVASRVKRTVTPLTLEAIFTPLIPVFTPFEPAFSNLEFRKVDPEIVPPDRLGGQLQNYQN